MEVATKECLFVASRRRHHRWMARVSGLLALQCSTVIRVSVSHVHDRSYSQEEHHIQLGQLETRDAIAADWFAYLRIRGVH